MTHKENDKRWYVASRGELLAQVFLQELHPASVETCGKNSMFDYIATFLTSGGAPKLIAIEVKSTERAIGGSFPLATDLILRLAASNVPTMILVVNVKSNEVFYAWAKDAAKSLRQSTKSRICAVAVKRADGHEKELLEEIYER